MTILTHMSFTQGLRSLFLDCLTLQKEVLLSFEMPGSTHLTTQRHIPEQTNLQESEFSLFFQFCVNLPLRLPQEVESLFRLYKSTMTSMCFFAS